MSRDRSGRTLSHRKQQAGGHGQAERRGLKDAGEVDVGVSERTAGVDHQSAGHAADEVKDSVSRRAESRRDHLS